MSITRRLLMSSAISPGELRNLRAIIGYTPRWYAREDLFEPHKTTIVIPAATEINVGGNGYVVSQDTTLDLSTIGTAADRAGKDVYIYACQPTSNINNLDPTLVLSLDSTAPAGYTEHTSRKIGGFHCLCADVGVIDGHDLSGYVAGDILPASVWDLLHLPKSDPEGMVYSKEYGQWVDIYLPSWDETAGKLVSKYNGVICDGTSTTIKFNGEKFVEYFGKVTKHLLPRSAFMVVMKGTPECVAIKGSADPNTTGGHIASNDTRIISYIGIEDCTGVLWQWGEDTYEYAPGTTWSSNNFYLSGYSWQSKSVFNSTYDDTNRGSCPGLLRRVLLGAYWSSGSGCGSRAACCYVFSAYGSADCSARGASEPRVVNL